MTFGQFVDTQEWTFAKTYAKTAPHEYLVRKNELQSKRKTPKTTEVRRMKLIEISNETLKDHPDIYYKNVQFFMFAEGGAMGEPGEIRFITEKDGEIRAYHTNYTYGEFDVRNIDVIFPALKDFRIDILGHSEGDNPYFYYVRLGMGNHLFVRKRLQKQFDGTFKDVTSPGEVYQRWFDTAIHLLETEGNQQ